MLRREGKGVNDPSEDIEAPFPCNSVLPSYVSGRRHSMESHGQQNSPSSRVMSSSEGTPVTNHSPAPKQKGRPRKNSVIAEQSSIGDERSLFCKIRSGKISLQVQSFWILVN